MTTENIANISELIAQRNGLDQAIKQAQVAARRDVATKMYEMINAVGMTLQEASEALLSVAKHANGSSRTGTKVAPRYRHVASGATWTGRGKAPLWFRNATDTSEIENLRAAD